MVFPENAGRQDIVIQSAKRSAAFLLTICIGLIGACGRGSPPDDGTTFAADKIPFDAEPFLHKNAKLGIGRPGDLGIFKDDGRLPIDPREAARFAVAQLRKRGVKDILICESHWIAAAISGYLVDGLGRLTIGGRDFTTFRVGIRDGLEARHGAEYDAGREFVFIAFGCDANGRTVWYPDPGPDFMLGPDQNVPEGYLSYEFLLHRPEFESLSVRYGR
jgi:hypothetical protein